VSQPTWADLTEPCVAPGPHDWNDDGVVYLERFMPESILDAYEREWKDCHGNAWPPGSPGGWRHPTPYMEHTSLMRLFTWKKLQDEIQKLIGEPPGLHLCLTGWVSTQRDWHQDTYLNPRFVGDSYCAVWVALEDITADSGPFQYIRGSHRWRTITRDKIGHYIDINVDTWPSESERILSPIVEEQIRTAMCKKLVPIPGGMSTDFHVVEEYPEVVTYLPKRGDVLLWHSRLMHRGSRPTRPGAPRRAVIAHLSGISHRHDMRQALRYPETGGYYFPIRTLGQDNVMKREAVTFS